MRHGLTLGELLTYLNAIQGVGGRFVPRVDGCYFNVVGLPLARLCHELSLLGWQEDGTSLE